MPIAHRFKCLADGKSLKTDTVQEAVTSELMISYLNSPNYSSISVSSKSYYLFKTCLNVWFKSCRLMKSVSFRTIPILLHLSVLQNRWLQPYSLTPHQFPLP